VAALLDFDSKLPEGRGSWRTSVLASEYEGNDFHPLFVLIYQGYSTQGN
jgi:hypothetical protein